MPAIALLVKESLSWLIKVVTTPRNCEVHEVGNKVVIIGDPLLNWIICDKLLKINKLDYEVVLPCAMINK